MAPAPRRRGLRQVRSARAGSCDGTGAAPGTAQAAPQSASAHLMAPAPTGSPGRVSWYGRMAAAVTLRRMTSDAPSPRPPPHPPSPVPGQSEAVPGQSEADPGQSEAARDEPGIDLHTTAGKIADLQRRRDEAVHAGSARAVERQHAKGKMTARERIERLLDPGSFTELDE